MKKSVDGMMVELNSMQQVLVNKSISIFDENFNTGKTVKGGLISEGTYFYFWFHPQKDVPNHYPQLCLFNKSLNYLIVHTYMD